MSLRRFGRRVGDIFFAVGVRATRVLGWLARWAALPIVGVAAVAVALGRDLWLAAVIGESLFAVVLVYATLLQLALERSDAARRRSESARRDLEAEYTARLTDLQQAREHAAGLRAEKANLALRVAILEAQARDS